MPQGPAVAALAAAAVAVLCMSSGSESTSAPAAPIEAESATAAPIEAEREIEAETEEVVAALDGVLVAALDSSAWGPRFAMTDGTYNHMHKPDASSHVPEPSEGVGTVFDTEEELWRHFRRTAMNTT